MTDTHRSDALLVVGEAHTALLRSSAALPVAACERLVSLVGGERVLRYERPIAHTVSPPQLTGVDCRLATATGVKARVIGTVSGSVSITGGHVAQGSAVTQLFATDRTQRRDWSHYLSRPGQVELMGAAPAEDIIAGFLAPEPHPATLDLGAVGARLVNDLQTSPALDGQVPFRVERTRLRWAAVPEPAGATPVPRFRVEKNGLRTLLVRGGAVEVASIAEFAADLALHDWLLTALLRLIERSRLGIDAQPAVVARLRPAVEHLLHLWMPGARMHESTTVLWSNLERRPGLSRQWQALVNRIRDQLALSAITLLSERLGETVG